MSGVSYWVNCSALCRILLGLSSSGGSRRGKSWTDWCRLKLFGANLSTIASKKRRAFIIYRIEIRFVEEWKVEFSKAFHCVVILGEVLLLIHSFTSVHLCSLFFIWKLVLSPTFQTYNFCLHWTLSFRKTRGSSAKLAFIPTLLILAHSFESTFSPIYIRGFPIESFKLQWFFIHSSSGFSFKLPCGEIECNMLRSTMSVDSCSTCYLPVI